MALSLLSTVAKVEVRCEACGTRFVKYQHVEVSAGFLATTFGNPQETLRKAAEAALTTERIGARVCPNCGYVQSWMIKAWRARRRFWLIFSSVWIVPFLLGGSVVGIVSLFVERLSVGLVALALGFISLSWLWFWTYRRLSVPNHGATDYSPLEPALSVVSPDSVRDVAFGSAVWRVESWGQPHPARAVWKTFWYGLLCYLAILFVASMFLAGVELKEFPRWVSGLVALFLFGGPVYPAIILARRRYRQRVGTPVL